VVLGGGSMARFRRLAPPVLLTASCLAGLMAAGPSLADAPAPARVYDVESYDVDGVKLLKTEDVETAVYPFLGPGRTRDDIEKARAALQKLYQERGYASVVVEIPAQSISETAPNYVQLHVVEATVERLRVTGARYFSPDQIRDEAKAFQEGTVPNVKEAQKELTELDRPADRRVNPVLRPGEVPGTVDVDLKVTDQLPLHASLDLDNDHNQFTTPLRLYATVHYDNLWQLGHSISFTYAVAPENTADSEIFSGSYLAPIPNTPFSAMVFGYDSNSNVASLGGTTVLGKGYSIGARFIDQLPRIAGWTENLNAGFDFKNFNENINVSNAPATADVVQYLPLTVAYDLRREGDKDSTKASISLTVGTRGVGSNTADFENKRFDARPNFVHLNLEFTQTENFLHGFTATAHVVGQIADGPLVSSEQFAAGGLTSVRGYLQSEAVGDEGFTGTLQITSPTLAPRGVPEIDDLRVFVFADGGQLWVLQPLAEQAHDFSLASAGMGVSIALMRHLKAEGDLAVPFITGAATHADRPRASFKLKSDF
jgi:hemolysin activation/secretion protein